MKILYVHNQPVPSPYANGIQVVRMCSAFAGLGHEVVLSAPPAARLAGTVFDQYRVPRTFRLVPLPRPRMRLGGRFFGLLAAIYAASRRFDLVYTRCVLTAYSSARLGNRVALELHMPPSAFRATTRDVLDKLVRLPTLRRIVVISDAIRQQTLVDLSPAQVPIVVAHDGAAPLIASALSSRPLHAIDHQAIEGRQFSAVYVGHLYPGKGMEMISTLARLLPDVRFDVVGGLSKSVKEARTQSLRLPNLRVHGAVPHWRVNDYLADADVALAPFGHRVLSSNGDEIAKWMSPLKLFEYMAAGNAIIASDLPALREVITHGRDALLCPPDDTPSWVTAINALQRDPSLRSRLGQNAQRLFEAEYTWERRADRVLDGLS